MNDVLLNRIDEFEDLLDEDEFEYDDFDELFEDDELEDDVISFLNEYYLINSGNLPKAEFF